MVVDLLTDPAADSMFQALADPTRRGILAAVMHGEHSVSELARRYPMSFAAVQKHVAVLERADLVTKRKRGREQLVTGNAEALQRVRRLLDQLEALWTHRLDRIADILAEGDVDDRPAGSTSSSTDPA